MDDGGSNSLDEYKRKSSWVIALPKRTLSDRIVSKYWNIDDVSTLNIRSIVRETIATVDRERPLGVRPFRFSRGT